MTPLRKALFGYDIGDVKRHLRYIRNICDMELTEWQEKVAAAEKYRNTLREEWTALSSEFPILETGEIPHKEEIVQEEFVHEEVIQEDVVPNDDSHMEKVEDVIDLNEVVYKAVEHAAEEIAVAVSIVEQPRVATNVIQFRRKMDAKVADDCDYRPGIDYHLAEGSGFWEGVGRYLDTPPIPEEAVYLTSELLMTQPNIDGTNLAAQYPRYFNYQIVESPTQLGLSAAPDNERRGKQKKVETIIPSPVSASASQSAPITESGGSRQITREVRQLRYQYIVGKWAGEDLVNDRGELIIAKHQPITETIIDEADREGKLALLIVNMTIPGLMEED